MAGRLINIKQTLHSLAGQLGIGVFLTQILLFPFIWLAITSIIERTLVDSFLDESRLSAYLVANTLPVTENSTDHEFSERLDSLLLSGRIIYAQLELANRSINPNLSSDQATVFIEDTDYQQHQDSVYFVSIRLRTNTILRLGFDESITRAAVTKIKQQVSLYLLLYTLISIIITVILTNFFVKPIQQLRSVSRHIASGHYDSVLATSSRITEVIELSSDLESMRAELVNQNTTVQRLSERDVLTQLPNRMVLNQRLEQSILTGLRSQIPFSLLLLDIDNFKEINDTSGHQSGDLLLQEYALRLLGAKRISDTVARLGGDEFALLLHNVDQEQVQQRCDEIMQVLAKPINLDGNSLTVACSLGIACFPLHSADGTDLLRKADVAMYQAKASDRASCIYNRDTDRRQLRLVMLRQELENAIPNNQFQLYYQPKVEVANAKIIGAEALIRWQHPDQGVVPPDQFIGIAEKSALIDKLTYWVIDQGLKDLKQWQQQGRQLSLAFNISPKNLLNENFGDEVLALLAQHQIQANCIELELTENDILAEPLRAARILKQLALAGVRIAIDDFGTGYSSLSYLKKLPLTTLKIDRSFLMEMQGNDDNAAIVKATVELAHNLSLKVVAEGVEHADIAAYLRGLNCDYAQGYHYGRPLPKNQFSQLLPPLLNPS